MTTIDNQPEQPQPTTSKVLAAKVAFCEVFLPWDTANDVDTLADRIGVIEETAQAHARVCWGNNTLDIYPISLLHPVPVCGVCLVGQKVVRTELLKLVPTLTQIPPNLVGTVVNVILTDDEQLKVTVNWGAYSSPKTSVVDVQDSHSILDLLPVQSQSVTIPDYYLPPSTLHNIKSKLHIVGNGSKGLGLINRLLKEI